MIDYRKITWNGSSLLIAIPPAMLSKMQLKKGNYVKLELKADSKIVVTALVQNSATLAKKAARGGRK